MVIEDGNDAPQLEHNDLSEHTNDEPHLGTIFLKGQLECNVDDFSWDDIDQCGLSDHDEFDDSSDQDYKQSEESDESEDGDESDWLVGEDDMLDEETSKDMGGANNNEQDVIGGWCDDFTADEDDLLIYECSDEEGPRHPVFREGQDMSNFKLVVGLRFKDAKQCRDVLTDVSVREGFELTFIKNEKKRIIVECKEKCGWRFHASVVMGGPTIQIKTLKGRHTCPRAHTNWRANYKYLAGKIEKSVRENPDMKGDRISQYISRECGVDVSKWTVYRAKKTAMQKIRGVDSVQYAILRDYCETILKYNPGSKIIIRNREGSDPPTFGKLYYSLFGLKMNFLSACRPIIGLDGCFLKIAFGGQLLAAIGRDGNDGMVPIAIALVETENYETWIWFLTELLEDIGGIGEDRWTFVSDRQKGLLEALRDLVPDCEHRFCARHMLQNFKKKFKNPELIGLYWKAAGTGNKNVFDAVMKEIAELDPKLDPNHQTAVEWLGNIPPKHWAKSYFLTQCKSECFVNNICESFNNLILADREQPIITMLEGITNKLMKMTQMRRLSMEEYTGNICPNILRRIQKAQDTSRSCFSIYSGDEEYQIQYVNGLGILEQFVVKLRDKSCTCGFFQLRGYPCCHAAWAIAQGRHKIQDYVAKYFFKDEYLKGYSYMIHAVPGVVDYCKSTCEPLRPPPIKTKRGRPKKNRKKDPDEGRSVSTRRGLTHTCSRCLEVGHNKATCSKPVHPKSKFYKRPEGVGNGDEIGHQSTQASSSAFSSRKRKKNQESRPTQNSTTRQKAVGPLTESIALAHGSIAQAHGSMVDDFNAAERCSGGPTVHYNC